MHRSPPGRAIALLLAFLASVSAPGAALAHGAAHQREHRGDHAPRTSQPHEAHGHAHGHSHGERATAGTARVVERGAPGITLVGRVMASPDERHGSHGHPTLDLPVRPRVELAVILPLIGVAALIATPETEVDAAARVPHAALPRPDPDAAPPPRTRAPPLR